MQRDSDEPFALADIGTALVYKALAGDFLSVLNSFFATMQLEWGNTKTASAWLNAGVPTITLGKAFFAKHIQNVSEAADVVMHEILHHVFLHLFSAEHFFAQGYSDRIYGLATDAIINAHLAPVGCAGFMERYYPDEDEWAFLRPNSEPAYLRKGRTGYNFSEHLDIELHQRRATLEKALAFFQRHFPDLPQIEFLLLGDHTRRSSNAGEIPVPTGASHSTPGRAGGGNQWGDDPLFGPEEATRILKVIAKDVSLRTKNNFARVIKNITTHTRRPGILRIGTTLSRRLPTTLSALDMLNIERGLDLFRLSDHRLREFWILLDVSGSVEPYLPFVVGLMQSMRLRQFEVHGVCWATKVAEVSWRDICQGKFPPDIGTGTNGEAVAQFLARRKIKKCAIVTDNEAGDIRTRITATVHLARIHGDSFKASYRGKKGKHSLPESFLNPSKVPDCHLHELVIEGL